jgi:hypothetical protein
MIRYRITSSVPEVVVHASGVVTADSLRHAFDTFPGDLRTLDPGFVLVVHHPALVMFEAEAVGLIYTLVARVFDAEPGLVVFVDGGRTLNEGLRGFIDRLDTEGRARFVSTKQEADGLVRRFAAGRTPAGSRPAKRGRS